MKKITILTAMFLAMFGIQQSSAAESWVSGEALPDSAGLCYLYNIGAQKYLSAGADWGTHAVVDTYGFATNLTKIRNGVYTIKTVTSNGGNSTYLNGLYCDGASANWFFIPTGDSDHSFYISSDSTKRLGYDGTNVGLIDQATGNNSKWYVISGASRISALKTAMATASEASPVDITPMIADPDFGRNRTDNKWQGSPALGEIGRAHV